MSSPIRRPSRAAIVAAFTAVYVIWGSTYLAIRFGIQSVPPLLMAGSRFLLAGLLLFAIACWRGAPRPDAREWGRATILGATLLLAGNGGVTIGELWVPSSVAALLIALVPLFVALLGWLSGAMTRPGGLVWLGLAVGLAGVALLLQPKTGSPSESGFLLGAAIILGGALLWSAGSLYGGRSVSRTSPLANAGMQMICGGVLLLIASASWGELRTFSLSQVTSTSWLAWGYLVIFGAMIGFNAYSWLLQNCPPAQVATYAYVNPVVAVALGATIGGEKVTASILGGAAFIVIAVAIAISHQPRPAPGGGLREQTDAGVFEPEA